MEWYTAVSLAAAIVVMVSASYFDWRYREVPDLHWWVLGISGLVLTAASFGDIGTEVLMMLIGSALLLLLILLDLNVPAVAELIVFLIMVALFAYPAVTAFDDPNVKRMLVIPVCCLIFYLMFSFGILKGGADAKCLMTMAMMFKAKVIWATPNVGLLGFVRIRVMIWMARLNVGALKKIHAVLTMANVMRHRRTLAIRDLDMLFLPKSMIWARLKTPCMAPQKMNVQLAPCQSPLRRKTTS